MSTSPVFVGSVKTGLVQVVNADASALKTVVTAGSSGSRVTSLRATSDDTSARVVSVYKTRSGTSYLLGSMSVTALAGSDGAVVGIDLMSDTYLPGLPVDNNGNHYIHLQSGDTLQVKTLTTVTSGKTVHVCAEYGDL